MEYNPTQSGVVLLFRDGTSPEDAQKIVNKLAEQGDIENCPRVRQFDPEWGQPVWYIP